MFVVIRIILKVHKSVDKLPSYRHDPRFGMIIRSRHTDQAVKSNYSYGLFSEPADGYNGGTSPRRLHPQARKNSALRTLSELARGYV
jgi:hypothetical protein